MLPPSPGWRWQTDADAGDHTDVAPTESDLSGAAAAPAPAPELPPPQSQYVEQISKIDTAENTAQIECIILTNIPLRHAA